MSETYEYRIELETGAVVETNSMRFAAYVLSDGESDEDDDTRISRGNVDDVSEARESARSLFDEKPEHVPFQVRKQNQLDLDVTRLNRLRNALRQKAGGGNRNPNARAAYQDTFEKLDAVLRGDPWTEDP